MPSENEVMLRRDSRGGRPRRARLRVGDVGHHVSSGRNDRRSTYSEPDLPPLEFNRSSSVRVVAEGNYQGIAQLRCSRTMTANGSHEYHRDAETQEHGGSRRIGGQATIRGRGRAGARIVGSSALGGSAWRRRSEWVMPVTTIMLRSRCRRVERSDLTLFPEKVRVGRGNGITGLH